MYIVYTYITHTCVCMYTCVHVCMYVYVVSLVYVSFLLKCINFVLLSVAEERAKLHVVERERGRLRRRRGSREGESKDVCVCV